MSMKMEPEYLVKELIVGKDYGKRLTGNNPLASVVHEWHNTGLSIATMRGYIDNGVFSPDAAGDLFAADITPEEAGLMVDHETGNYPVGYAFSEGELPLQDVVDLVNIEREKSLRYGQ